MIDTQIQLEIADLKEELKFCQREISELQKQLITILSIYNEKIENILIEDAAIKNMLVQLHEKLK